MQSWKTFGHDSVKALFDKLLEREQFSHSYLFIGPSGVGKKTLALEVAQKITGSQNSIHPDILLLDQLVNEGSEAVRSAIALMSGTPLKSKHRVVIITDIDRFNHQSLNALLKILEEPPKATIFFLTADSRSVLATIQSRSIVLPCNPLTGDQMISWLNDKNLSYKDEDLVLAAGCPGILLSLVENEVSKKVLYDRLNSLEQASFGNSIDKVITIQNFAELDTVELESLLRFWIVKLRRSLNDNPKNYLLLAKAVTTLQNLQLSLNKKLLLQSLLFS
jgi:DNA polymerase-3 subunit delta'